MFCVLPGEIVPAQHVNLKLGPGLRQIPLQDENITVSTKAGMVQHSANNAKWWIDSNSRRYVPAAQESVVGVVVQKAGEGFRVDIGSAHMASLDGLAFEGATKRNRPNLKIGSLVYARVSLAHKDMEPELECFDAQTRKAEGFGELKQGFLVKCSLRMARLLMSPDHFLLPFLGSLFPLEAAVGMNGRVWISASSPKQIIAMKRCIEGADPDGGGVSESDLKQFVHSLDLI
ncbi:hypothetical protein FISHEDRAFT_49792 [Fistulina hepatica ATCC 64428]|uniref:Ribosomal RNA-processing protein 40 n=1 Tax=Fistulina hepatica ATCC 64428 TaxID=1128425 RepID=A0A0D7A476_9AGAR|nr:hypothetical protein FISHEDRAFT_49792 [Fistulina hepatica ATCC 64428]